MNPFTLPGPSFLAFFAALIVVTLVATVLLRRRLETGPIPRVDLADPYLLALLRGGRDEAVLAALAVLIDRRLLAIDGKDIAAGDRYASAAGLANELEKDLCARVAGGPQPIYALVAAGALSDPVVALERRLAEADLLPSAATVERRERLLWIAGGLVVVVAVIKLWVALAGGHHNVLFLITFPVVAVAILRKVLRPRLTMRGTRLVADVQTLYGRLRERASKLQPGGGSADLALLVGAFGLAALPVGFPQGPVLASAAPPPPVRQPGGSCNSGCGSSGGSSCGGGCGGGCGGCGGD
jgi:uncharacterized protein (TIGR04222 family)